MDKTLGMPLQCNVRGDMPKKHLMFTAESHYMRRDVAPIGRRSTRAYGPNDLEQRSASQLGHTVAVKC